MSGKSNKQQRRKESAALAGVVFPALLPPNPRSAIVAAVSARDRQYLAAHPELDYYIRERVPGEFGFRDSADEVQRATHVLVSRIPAGRLRRPVMHTYAIDDGHRIEDIDPQPLRQWPPQREYK